MAIRATLYIYADEHSVTTNDIAVKKNIQYKGHPAGLDSFHWAFYTAGKCSYVLHMRIQVK